MAVIHFSASDALQTKVVPSAIYPSEISSINGPTKSSSGKNMNIFLDIMISDGPFKGKTRTIAFSTGSNAMSLLGEMQFFPQPVLLELDAAITGREIVPEDYSMDLDTLLHKVFDASWGVDTVNGHLINTINGFHPRGYSATAPAF